MKEADLSGFEYICAAYLILEVSTLCARSQLVVSAAKSNEACHELLLKRALLSLFEIKKALPYFNDLNVSMPLLFQVLVNLCRNTMRRN